MNKRKLIKILLYSLFSFFIFQIVVFVGSFAPFPRGRPVEMSIGIELNDPNRGSLMDKVYSTETYYFGQAILEKKRWPDLYVYANRDKIDDFTLSILPHFLGCSGVYDECDRRKGYKKTKIEIYEDKSFILKARGHTQLHITYDGSDKRDFLIKANYRKEYNERRVYISWLDAGGFLQKKKEFMLDQLTIKPSGLVEVGPYKERAADMIISGGGGWPYVPAKIHLYNGSVFDIKDVIVSCRFFSRNIQGNTLEIKKQIAISKSIPAQSRSELIDFLPYVEDISRDTGVNCNVERVTVVDVS